MNKYSGITRVQKACINSLAGIRATWRHEEAFRHEVLLALLLVPLALWLGESGVQRAVLIAAMAGVLIAELLNSALEALADHISTDHQKLIGRAKDMGSAAVFVAMINVLLCFGLIGYARFSNG